MTQPDESGDMELFRGKIYAVVPERAHGFTVKTDTSKIVDLGTEFGVEVDSNNNTQLHVTKGSTKLFAGYRPSAAMSIQARDFLINYHAKNEKRKNGAVTNE